MTTSADNNQPLLGPDFPLPLAAPFTSRTAADAGISRTQLSRLTSEKMVRRILKGVYGAAQLVDDSDTRIAALALVAPHTAVVTDETAAWAHGADVYPPGSHLATPPISMFQLAGNTRLRNALCNSGQRSMLPCDVVVVNGVMLTTPLRTALDLGRLRHRDRAIGALDALLRLGRFEHEDLLGEVERFKGERGVVQLRELAPLADGRSQSMVESALRLRWKDTNGLPQPTPQIPVLNDYGEEIFYLDLGVEEIRYAAEYDGEEYHSSPEAKERDRKRRKWMREKRLWTIDVLKKDNVFGPDQDVQAILRRGVATARRNLSTPTYIATRRQSDPRNWQLGA